ncbi:MAG: hypothetical protein Q4C41_03325 [Eggerthellaceae bacterium]|nr:hypothetical protein [Eggerthellaceae bacterium]
MENTRGALLTSGRAVRLALATLLAACALALAAMLPQSAWATGSTEPTSGENETTYIAKIGETGYGTISAALENANNGDVIKVIANATESVTIPAGKSVTLDIAANVTLTNTEGSHTITNNGTLTVTGAGTVDNKSHAKGALVNNAGAIATLNGGTFKRSSEAGTSGGSNGGNSWYTIKNQGTLTINAGVTVESKLSDGSFSGYSSVIANGWQHGSTSDIRPAGATATLTINGGTIEGGLYVKNDDGGKLVVNGGSIKGNSAGVFNYGEAEIAGGTISVNRNDRYAVWNYKDGDTTDAKLVISGGTLQATGQDQAAVYQSNANGVGSVEITGGTLNGAVQGTDASGKSAAVAAGVSITGGTFTSDVSAYVADGYALSGESGGTVGKATTQAEDSVAVVDGQYFRTLQGAVNAATDGATVTVLKNCEIDSTVEVNKGITLDLGGNTVTVVGPDATGKENPGFLFNGGNSKLLNGTILDNRSNGNASCGYLAVRVIGASTSLETETLAVQTYRPNSKDNYNYILRVDGGGQLVMSTGTSLVDMPLEGGGYDTYGAVGVSVWSGEGIVSKLTVAGAEINTMGFAVAGNGTAHGTEITVKEGSKLVSSGSTGIFHPQSGTLTVEGGTITGTTGIEMRAGVLNVSGDAIITGTAGSLDVEPNNSGSTTVGAGIAVAQHTTKLPIKVNVKGGTISGYSAFYESNPQKNGAGDLAKISLSIEDGDFVATQGGKQAVYSEDIENFVKAGNFSSSLDEKYLDDSLIAELYSTNKNPEAPYSYYRAADDAIRDALTIGGTVKLLNVGEETDTVSVTLKDGDKTTTVQVKKGDSLTLPTLDDKSLCVQFEGWGADKVIDITPTENVMLEAQWSEPKHAFVWKCDADGHWQECSKCGETTDKGEHAFKWMIDKEATATEPGSKHEVCTVCGYEKGSVEIPATGNGSGEGSNDNTTADKPAKPAALAKTGDAVPATALAAAGVAAAAAIACGFAAFRKGRKSE